MPATDDEIREKYLERAIRELNSLTRDLQACRHCPRGNLMPVLGSGHPQADVLLLKHAPAAAEIEEGVAFYGRSGTALMKSLERLDIDPLAVYGTLCVKCPVGDPARSPTRPASSRVVEEIAIVQPRIVVVMGEDALDALNDLELPLAQPAAWPRPARSSSSRRRSTRSTSPNIDESLDEEAPSAPSGRPSGRSASGTRTCRRTRRPAPQISRAPRPPRAAPPRARRGGAGTRLRAVRRQHLVSSSSSSSSSSSASSSGSTSGCSNMVRRLYAARRSAVESSAEHQSWSRIWPRRASTQVSSMTSIRPSRSS